MAPPSIQAASDPGRMDLKDPFVTPASGLGVAACIVAVVALASVSPPPTQSAEPVASTAVAAAFASGRSYVLCVTDLDCEDGEACLSSSPGQSCDDWSLARCVCSGGFAAKTALRMGPAPAAGKVLPGLQVFNNGFNAANSRLTIPLFKTTMSGKTWRGADDVEYEISDEVNVSEIPDGSFPDVAKVFKSVREYDQWLASEAGAEFERGMFSQTAEVQSLLEKYFRQDTSVSTVAKLYGKYGIDRENHDVSKQLSPLFVRAIEYLPETLDSEDAKATYNKFIDSYGTHYVSQASFGGQAQVTSYVKNCVFFAHTSETISANTKYDFFLGSGSHHVDGQVDIQDKTYSDNRMTTMSLLGGDPLLDPRTKYDEWTASIFTNPGLIRHALRPLSDLVASPAVKSNLDQAVREYIASKATNEVGCKDPEAFNYDPDVTVDDRTLCKPKVVPDCKQVVVSGGAPHEGAVNLGSWSDGQAVWLANGPHPTYGCVVSHAYAGGKDTGSEGARGLVYGRGAGLTLVAARSDDFCKKYGAEHSVTATVNNGVSCNGTWNCNAAYDLKDTCSDERSLKVTVLNNDWSKGCNFAAYSALYQPHAIQQEQ